MWGVKTMASFSIGEALGSGFGVIKRNPVAVVAWGIVYTIISFLPLILMWFVAGPELRDLFATAGSGQPPTASPEFMALNAKLSIVQPLSILASILAAALLNAAIYRAVLRPQDKGFLYMKLGQDELWQGLIALCLGILMIMIVIAISIIAAAIGVVIWFAGEAAGGGAVHVIGFILLGLAVFAAIIWIALRFSLAGPATFATRSFQLFESWTLTKGQTGGLFGLALLLILVGIAIYIVMALIFGVAFVATGVTAAMNPTALENADPAAILAMFMPFIIVVCVLSALLTGALYTLFMAPWASAYRQLTPVAADVDREFI